MEEWRFLEIDWITYAETAILRPVIMKAISDGIAPNTVSFCTFPKSSLVLNYFNDPHKDIDLEFCKEKGIPVCRVISGGGPILGDTGYTFTFLHLRRDTPNLPPNAPKMFEMILPVVAEGLSEYFDIDCRFRPLNDLEIKCDDGVWRKIGPTSCFYDENVVQLGSGLQIREPDTELIASAIPAPPEKFLDKEAKSTQERITYLEKAVARSIELEEIKRIYWEQIEKAFEVKLSSGELSEKEKGYYREMENEYTSEPFLLERSESKVGPIPSDVARKMLRFKIPNGPLIRIITFTRHHRVRNILISGSIHASPLRPTSPVHEIEKALTDVPIDEGLFRSRIEEILNRENFNFAKVTSDILAKKIYECATGK